MMICYLVFRLMSIGLMKIADSILLDLCIFNASRFENLSDSSRVQLNAFLSPNPVRSIMPTYYQTLTQRVMELRQSIKEPLGLISDATNHIAVGAGSDHKRRPQSVRFEAL